MTIVRTGPDPQRLKPVAPDARLRRGREHLVAYIGVMGPQDGVDIVLKLADIVVNKLGRHDTAFTIMGSGDCFNDLVAMRDRLGLQDVVEFTGRVPDETVAAVLSTAAVGISPDPKNSFNDLSTMNKTMEYMAFALPVIAFDLRDAGIGRRRSRLRHPERGGRHGASSHRTVRRRPAPPLDGGGGPHSC